MIRLIYILLLILITPILVPSLLKKKQGKPAYGSRKKELFGFGGKANNPIDIWLHAVSVGEVIAATPLIKELKHRYPEKNILVTTTTTTGAEQVAKLGDLVEHRYCPLDFPFAVKSFLKQVQPKQLLIMETELWPNLLYYCGRQGISVTVLNARLSERSAKRYAKFQWIFNLLSSNISQLLCQYESDAIHFKQLGIASEKITVTGSIKFDIKVADDVPDQARQLREQLGTTRPVWIAASTHKGEDEIVLKAHQQILTSTPNALLILVPRHPERFNTVFELCQQSGFYVVKRSSGQAVNDAQVYLADTMGEMMILLGASDLCFMGGSLLGDKVGGHNLLEPAALGVPMLNGISYYNFSVITEQLLEANAVILCEDAMQIAQQVDRLFTDKQQASQMGQAGLYVVEHNRGALDKTIQALNL